MISYEELDSNRFSHSRTSYRYGGDGRRLLVTYEETQFTDQCTVAQVVGEATAYEYANGEVLNERTGGSVPVWYIRGPDGELLYTLHWDGQTLRPSPYVTDHLGSIQALVGFDGAVGKVYDYAAFGAANITTSDTGIELRNNYAFTGYGIDEQLSSTSTPARTGLYYAQARYYEPALGRFMTQDTWRGDPWQPWTQNMYSYVGNNPVNYTDPTGHLPRALLNGIAQVYARTQLNLGIVSLGIIALNLAISPHQVYRSFHEIAQANLAKALRGQAILEVPTLTGTVIDVLVSSGEFWEIKPIGGGSSPWRQIDRAQEAGFVPGGPLSISWQIPIIPNLNMTITFPAPGLALYGFYDRNGPVKNTVAALRVAGYLAIQAAIGAAIMALIAAAPELLPLIPAIPLGVSEKAASRPPLRNLDYRPSRPEDDWSVITLPAQASPTQQARWS